MIQCWSPSEPLAATSQPLAGKALSQTQPPLVLGPLPQTQPLAEDAQEDNIDDSDFQGLDNRPAVGEQTLEEETAQAERQHQGEDSEAEEIAFKLKVSAVVRVAAKAKRFAMAPRQRFRQAVEGGGAAAELGMQVHRYARRVAEGLSSH